MPTEIVIVGGGIVGRCTALYVLESAELPLDARVTLIESATVAWGASGRAAGFISSGTAWLRPPVRDLARLSDALWAELVARFEGRSSFGYREVNVSSLAAGTNEDDVLDEQYARGALRGAWCNGELLSMTNGNVSYLL
jgi:glycine/D-amino acid oxidase-like deaminating enzyme